MPTKQEDVPATIETLKETLTALKTSRRADQDQHRESQAKIAKTEEDKKEAEAKAEVEEPVATPEIAAEATEEHHCVATEA